MWHMDGCVSNSNLILEIKVEKVQTAYIRHMQIEWKNVESCMDFSMPLFWLT